MGELLRAAYVAVGEALAAFEALRSQDVSRLPHDDAAADLAAFLAEQEDGR